MSEEKTHCECETVQGFPCRVKLPDEEQMRRMLIDMTNHLNIAQQNFWGDDVGECAFENKITQKNKKVKYTTDGIHTHNSKETKTEDE